MDWAGRAYDLAHRIVEMERGARQLELAARYAPELGEMLASRAKEMREKAERARRELQEIIKEAVAVSLVEELVSCAQQYPIGNFTECFHNIINRLKGVGTCR